MTKWNARTDAEWCRVMHGITGGHRPMTPTPDKDCFDLAYWEGVWIRDLLHVKPTPEDLVLDLGCGNGRFAVTCLPYGCQYVGMDPMQECVEFCRSAFEPWKNRYRFEHIDVYYRDGNPGATVKPIDFRIPLDEGSVSYAVAISVFTHLCTMDVATHYVAELLRVLAPGGTLYTTWFKSPPNEPTDVIERTVFDESDIRNLLAGTEWLFDERGETTAQHDQWWIWGRKPTLK